MLNWSYYKYLDWLIETNQSTAAAAQINDSPIPHIKSDASNGDHIPYNVVLSNDPFQDYETITIPVRGRHPTQGIQLIPCEIYKD